MPNNIIGPHGVIDMTMAQKVSIGVLAGVLQTDIGRAQQVKSVLLSSFGPAGFTYAANGFAPGDSVYSLQFTVTRLSTSAIKHLNDALYAGGIDALLALPNQQLPVNITLPFSQLGPSGVNVSDSATPTPLLTPPPTSYGEQVDFSGPYGTYFWELFFHAPSLVAKLLHDNQQFQAAEKWLQYVFNPTLAPDPLTGARFAQLLPENIDSKQAGAIFTALSNPNNGWIDADGNVTEAALSAKVETIVSATGTSAAQAEELKNLLSNRYLRTSTGRYWQFEPFRNHTLESLKDQLQSCAEIATYNDDPFDPHAIARLRIGAYEKATVIAYVNNLLDWGDQEFSLYTWESITTARMLYSYAYDLLGKRPEDLGPCADQFPTTFNEILARYQGDPHQIPQFLIDMENALGGPQATGPLLRSAGQPFNDLGGVFCVPDNAQLEGLWDRVEDRLHKIRNCLNIAGEHQPLPLFDPPINPADLVRAAATGGAFTGLASGLPPAIPNYRFSVLVERAEELTETVRGFGSALLGALERRDSEGLSLLRNTQEIAIQNLMTATREQAIQDLQEQLLSLSQSLASAQYRVTYFSDSLKQGLSAGEIANLTLMTASLYGKIAAIPFHGLSIAGYLAPNIFGFADGGMKFGDAIQAGAAIANGVSDIMSQSASIASVAAEYQRRGEDWTYAQQLAQFDVAGLQHQITSTQARLVSAQQDLTINRQEIANAMQVDTVLRSNFTNQQLYQWMAGRISAVYFQAFRLARELALAAQTAYQFELDRDDQFITFSTWGNTYQGLLAGEGLVLGLKQMRKSYVDNDSRRLEIEKTISVRQTFPQAFYGFKWGHSGGQPDNRIGQLDFMLGEHLFDFDYPGHYGRKIKSITVSIPSVIGPYQDFHATLTQHSNLIVLAPNPTAVDYAIYRTSDPSGDTPPSPPPGSVRENWTPNQQIAVSRGVDDAGLFTLDFRDERYLPFEGTGAVSSWTFSLPPETNRINFENISDIIIKVRYTARDGGDALATRVKRLYAQAGDRYAYLNASPFNLSRAFSSQWAAMFRPDVAKGTPTLTFQMSRGTVLPNLTGVTLHGVMLQLDVAGGAALNSTPGKEFIKLKVGAKDWVSIPIENNFGELTPAQIDDIGQTFTEVPWSLQVVATNAPGDLKTGDALDSTKLLDVALVLVYSARPFATS